MPTSSSVFKTAVLFDHISDIYRKSIVKIFKKQFFLQKKFLLNTVEGKFTLFFEEKKVKKKSQIGIQYSVRNPRFYKETHSLFLDAVNTRRKQAILSLHAPFDHIINDHLISVKKSFIIINPLKTLLNNFPVS